MLERLERLAVAGLGLIGFAAYMYGIFARYLWPQLAPDWTEEVAVYAILWAMLLCGGRLARENRHLRSGIMHVLVSARTERAIGKAGIVLAILFALVMAWQGVELVQFAAMLNERSRSSLQIPMTWIYAELPVAMALVAAGFAFALVREPDGEGGERGRDDPPRD